MSRKLAGGVRAHRSREASFVSRDKTNARKFERDAAGYVCRSTPRALFDLDIGQTLRDGALVGRFVEVKIKNGKADAEAVAEQGRARAV